MTFEELLAVLCDSEVKLTVSNDFRDVYSIADVKEAKLAYDLLTAYGFDAKFYPEDAGSTLYITTPSLEPEQLDQKLTAVMIYARLLKSMKVQLDTLCREAANMLKSPDYVISFANIPASGGKQISISVLPAASLVAPAMIAAVASQAKKAAAPAAPSVKKVPKYSKLSDEKTMFSGPDLLSDNNKIISKKHRQKQEADGYFRQLWLYVKGNSAVAIGIVVTVIIILFTLFSMFIVSKGFLCVDLAHNSANKNEWYCR